MKLLLTGEPKSGKTTLLENFIKTVQHSQGFVTREVREDGQRVGFALVSSDGKTAVLASIHSKSTIRVSKYGVDVDQLDSFLAGLPPVRPGVLLYVDEIGQMELFSEAFKTAVASYLDTNNHYVGTITSVYQDDFTRQVLSRSDVIVLHISPDNREQVQDVLQGLSNTIDLLDRLTITQQDALTHMAREYAGKSRFMQLKKLFNNAVKYVAEGRVSQLSPHSYAVRGNTRDHEVGISGKTFTCDCDLFNGSAEYTGNPGECSHIQSVKLMLAVQ